MAGKSDTFELDILKLVFNATAIANIADNAASSPLANLFVALHTADPYATDETATQSTSEANYTGYARISVARTTGGWSCATSTGTSKATPVAAITFGACTAGSNTITHWSVGVASSGATKILYAGAVSPSISVSTGVTPQLTTSSYVQED
jgi:hypothetical protein